MKLKIVFHITFCRVVFCRKLFVLIFQYSQPAFLPSLSFWHNILKMFHKHFSYETIHSLSFACETYKLIFNSYSNIILYFPKQNLENILFIMSSDTFSPVISLKSSIDSFKETAIISIGISIFNPCLACFNASIAFLI
jgi:hypothetical protein